MSEIDDKIREALNAEDQKILDQLGDDPGPIAVALESFKGSQRWLVVVLWIGGFAVFGLMIFSALNYFAAEDLKSSLSWGIGIILCGLAMVIVKIGSWQQMQTQILVREIKRLELRWLQTERNSVL